MVSRPEYLEVSSYQYLMIAAYTSIWKYSIWKYIVVLMTNNDHIQGRLEKAALSALGVLLIILMCAIVTQVVCSALDINPLSQFQSPLPLLGNAITLNSLLDFQWHLLLITGLIPMGIVWSIDRHVRVDFIYQRFSRTGRGAIDLIGNLIFALPFFFFAIPASRSFFLRAWSSDEGSANGGLNDLWLIKGLIVLGLVLLVVSILRECQRLVMLSLFR